MCLALTAGVPNPLAVAQYQAMAYSELGCVSSRLARMCARVQLNLHE